MRGAIQRLLLVAVAIALGIAVVGPGLDDPLRSGPAAHPPGFVPTTTTTVASTTTEPPPLAVEEVRVLVANASSVDGAAGRYTEVLTALNYATLSPVSTDPNIETTIVYHADGLEREAVGVAEAIGAPATTVQPVPVPAPVVLPSGQSAPHVIVLIGSDLAAG